MDLASRFAITGAGSATQLSRLTAGCTAVGLASVLCPWKEGFAVEIITVAFLAPTGQIIFPFYRETDESRDEYQCFGSVIGLNADPDIYLDAAQIFFHISSNNSLDMKIYMPYAEIANYYLPTVNKFGEQKLVEY
jgi:hypothetical protein